MQALKEPRNGADEMGITSGGGRRRVQQHYWAGEWEGKRHGGVADSRHARR